MAVDKDMSFVDHLEELRWHIIRAVAAVFVFAIAAFLAKDLVFEQIILAPSRPNFWTYRAFCRLGELVGSSAICIEELPFVIQNRTMTGQFSMHISSSVVIGLVCAFPYAFWEVWRFVSPGLYTNERRATTGAVFFVSLLFLTGIAFGYFLVAPLAVNFLSNYQVASSILNEIDLTSYVSTITMISLAGGLMFQLPMVILVLARAGLVTPASLRAFRRHALVIILVVSAIITPPDMVTQILISLPVFLLYEVSIVISGVVSRRREKALAAYASNGVASYPDKSERLNA